MVHGDCRPRRSYCATYLALAPPLDLADMERTPGPHVQVDRLLPLRATVDGCHAPHICHNGAQIFMALRARECSQSNLQRHYNHPTPLQVG